jgi:hypothetical protein
MPCLGASNTGSSPTPLCLATAPGPLAADRCSIVRGCSRHPPHLWSPAAPQLQPTVTAAGGGSFHPTWSYGASWRTPASGDERDRAHPSVGGRRSAPSQRRPSDGPDHRWWRHRFATVPIVAPTPPAVTAGDHRTCDPHQRRLRTDDRRLAAPRLPERAQRPGGVASENPQKRGPEAASLLQRTGRGASRRIRSPAAPRGSGQETGGSGEAFRRTEMPGRPRL